MGDISHEPSPQEEEMREYVREVFGVYADQAFLIVMCESGWNPKAENWSDAQITGRPSTGLFQHNDGFFPGWNDYRVSTDRAWEKFQARGWYPWRNCAKTNKLID